MLVRKISELLRKLVQRLWSLIKNPLLLWNLDNLWNPPGLLLHSLTQYAASKEQTIPKYFVWNSCKKNLTLLLKKILRSVNSSSCCNLKLLLLQAYKLLLFSGTPVYRELSHTIFQEFSISNTVFLLTSMWQIILTLISGFLNIFWIQLFCSFISLCSKEFS